MSDRNVAEAFVELAETLVDGFDVADFSVRSPCGVRRS